MNKTEYKVRFLDYLMGVGKTTHVLNVLKEDTENKYIYLTPFLDEVDRVKDKLSAYAEPLPIEGKKRKDFINLVSKGKNIVSTHSLFRELRIEDYSLFSEYTLILDEVLDVIEPLKISKRDSEMLFRDNVLRLLDNKKVETLDSDYSGRFNDLMERVDSGNVYFQDHSSFIWMFPPEMVTSFKKVRILSYNAIGSIFYYYLQYNKIPFEVQTAVGSGLLKKQISDKISIYEGRYNLIGFRKGRGGFPLSMNWFEKATPDQIRRLTKASRNFFVTYCKEIPSNERLVTTYKDFEDKVVLKGYKNSFAVINERATNKYSSRRAVSYLADRYMNPFIEKFLSSAGVIVNRDAWALNEMIQFIWRSAIRNGENIKLFIPSERMRNLLKDWLKK